MLILNLIESLRCKRWMMWADGMRDKLERPHSHNLEDYYQWIVREAKPEINSKLSSYQWLNSTGQQLSDMTSGKEKKEFNKVSKEVKSKWEALNENVDKRSAKVNHLLQVRKHLLYFFVLTRCIFKLRYYNSCVMIDDLFSGYLDAPAIEFEIQGFNEKVKTIGKFSYITNFTPRV